MDARSLTGPILALDLGRLTGVADGAPDGMPTSTRWILGNVGDGLSVCFAELIRQINGRMKAEPRPALVVKEAAFSLAAFRDHRVLEETVRSAYGLHAIVQGICAGYGVRCIDANVATVTKHFTGTAAHGGRDARKIAVMIRCRQLGYVPKDCTDSDRCDALAVWDWACASFARTPLAFGLFPK